MKQKLFILAALAAAITVPVAVGVSQASASKNENHGLSEKAQLGRAIFFDPSLSEPAGQSCASCHDSSHAFADPDKNAFTSKGVVGPLIGSRNTPSLMYSSFSPKFHYDDKEELYLGGQFWDGRASTLEEQAKGPFVNPLEMANPDGKTVVAKVRRAGYAHMFEQVFGQGALADDEKAYDRISEALAEFQRTKQFAPFTSKYDAYLAGETKLTGQEMRGLRLFEAEDKGNCAACHPSKSGPNGEPPLFTDFSYDNLGVPRNPDNQFYRLPEKFNPAGTLFVDRGLGGALGNQSEDGKFKVPTLRNIAITGPYTHNGYFKTLQGVVAFYNDRDVRPQCGSNMVTESDAMKQKCWPVPEVLVNVNREELGNLKLTQREIEDIVAFMKTLTDGYSLGK